MTFKDFGRILNKIGYKPGWGFEATTIFTDNKKSGYYFQIVFSAPDAATGLSVPQRGRKWMLSEHMTESEVVMTVLKAILTAEEHESRELFTYDGVAIFNPHIDINALKLAAIIQDKREVK